MNVVRRKIWRDLTRNKARTLLVALSTAVGVFALGLVFGLSHILRTRMAQDHQVLLTLKFKSLMMQEMLFQNLKAIQKGLNYHQSIFLHLAHHMPKYD